jgi:thymidine kinase
MSLRIVVGPMFAGKTSEIQGVVRRYHCLGKKVLVLTADIDNRYQKPDAKQVDSIVSHDIHAIPARGVPIHSLTDVLSWPEFDEAAAIVLDEAQFFDSSILSFVKESVDMHGKHMVVVGLDSDAEQRPFGHILALIALADSVEKKSALCIQCGDGTPAIFTRSLAKRDTQIVVGGANLYEPVCRRHFISC